MTINQILDEQMREFDERLTDGYGFLKDKMFIRDGGTSVIKEFRSFIHSYTRKLIESLAEEIINSLEEDVKTVIESDVVKEGNAINECISGVFGNERLKVKEILSNLE